LSNPDISHESLRDSVSGRDDFD